MDVALTLLMGGLAFRILGYSFGDERGLSCRRLSHSFRYEKSSTAFLGGTFGVSAGYPMAISACGSTFSGILSTPLTADLQKIGAQYQHAPKPCTCASRRMFWIAAPRLWTARSRSFFWRSSSEYTSISSIVRQARMRAGAAVNRSAEAFAVDQQLLVGM